MTVVNPGDINFSIDSFSGIGIDFNNLHLESYVIEFRKKLNGFVP